MKCQYCNTEINDENAFCMVCGKNVDEKALKCTQCGAELKKDAYFCSNCGFNCIGQATVRNADTVHPSNSHLVVHDLEYLKKSMIFKVLKNIVLCVLGITLASGYESSLYGTMGHYASTMAEITSVAGTSIAEAFYQAMGGFLFGLGDAISDAYTIISTVARTMGLLMAIWGLIGIVEASVLFQDRKNNKVRKGGSHE